MKSFLQGFSGYFRGLRYWLHNATLIRLSLVPFGLNVIFFVAGLAWSFSKIPEIVVRIVKEPTGWLQHIFYYGLYLVTALSLFFLVVLAVFALANLLSFPFNDLLSERTLRFHSVLPEGSTGLKAWLSKSFKNVGVMVRRSLLILVLAGLLFFATFIPGLGILAAAGSALLMAWDRMDYTFDHFVWPLRRRISFLRENLPGFLGFSLGLGLTAAIPIINMLIMPGSVVAAAFYIAQLQKREPYLEGPHS